VHARPPFQIALQTTSACKVPRSIAIHTTAHRGTLATFLSPDVADRGWCGLRLCSQRSPLGGLDGQGALTETRVWLYDHVLANLAILSGIDDLYYALRFKTMSSCDVCA
jgi:hypothetical protein